MTRRLSIITAVLAAFAFAVPSAAMAASHPTQSNITTQHTHPHEPIDDLRFSTFLGGASNDFYSDIAIDDDGYIYVAGRTTSADFPTTPKAFDRTMSTDTCDSELCGDVFIAKLDPKGRKLIYSTFLGGNHVEYSFGIAVDQQGAAYITGATRSSDFPTTPGAFDSTLDSDGSIFMAKLSPNGRKLIYSTLIGLGQSQKIAVDNQGATYITGTTTSPNFPVTQGAFNTTKNGGTDAFLLKLNKTGTALVYSTFFGGSGEDYAKAIAIDDDGAAYIAGQTLSADLPVTAGVFGSQFGGSSDSFVAKFNRWGSNLSYATYIGGQYNDSANAIAIDQQGAAYITGFTLGDYPVTSGAYDATYNDVQDDGQPDTVITKLNPNGSQLVYSTYVGSFTEDFGRSIAVDQHGEAYITGATLGEFPVTPGAFDTTFNTSRDIDAYALRLNSAGSALLYSTYLGGDESAEEGWGIVLDKRGVAVIVGHTQSTDFPTTAKAHDTSYNGGNNDIFITKLSMPAL
ncbi:MAG: SBBP repeat-containing protein [Roseiflexaceae bacterium]